MGAAARAATDFGRAATAAIRAHRLRSLAATVSVLLAVLGVVLLTSGTPKHRTPPDPQAAGVLSASPPAGNSHPRSPTPAHRSPARPARPEFMHITIPSIGVVAAVIRLGLNSDRTIEVPPLAEVGDAGWYRYSPLPGDPGPSVILGHINSARYGPGVFVRLSAMHPGDVITITRADHRTAIFRADQIAEYPKSRFPTQAIYGNTNGAKIRLITCGGRFDSSAGSYLDNIVVYGTLVSLSPA